MLGKKLAKNALSKKESDKDNQSKKKSLWKAMLFLSR
jgi:hypothetical protein